MADFFGTDADETITPVFVSASVLRAPFTWPSNVADLVYGGGGDDLITTVGGADEIYGGAGSDEIYGGDAADMISGGDDQDDLYGGAGGDTFYGGAGFDDLYGGLGNDTMFGGTDNDRLDGGEGVDEMRGGLGHDVYHVDNVGDVVIEFAGQGDDLVFSTIDYTLGAHVERLELLGSGALKGVGNSLDNTIQAEHADNFIDGRGGDDYLLAHSGDDVVHGGKGDDELYGGGGDDELRGQNGADILSGETGADMLIGGQGDDVFVYWSHSDSQPGAATRDTIRAGDGAVAFEGAGAAAGDRIDLSALDADLTLFDQQTLLWGGTGPGAVKSKGFVWVENVGADSYVRANLNNGAAPEFEIRIVDGGVDASDYSSLDFIML